MSSLTEEQRRRIEENKRKALARRQASPSKPAIVPSKPAIPPSKPVAPPPNPVIPASKPAIPPSNNTAPPSNSNCQQQAKVRTQAEIEANKQRALDKRRNKLALAQQCASINDQIHPEKAEPTKSKQLVNNYIDKVIKSPKGKGSSSHFLSNDNEKSTTPKPTTQSFAPSHSNLNGKPVNPKPTTSSFAPSSSKGGNEQQKAATFFGQHKGPKLTAWCIMIDRFRFKVTCDYCAPLIEVFKSMPTRSYDAITKDWSFKLEDYESLVKKAGELRDRLTLSTLPKAVLNVFRNHVKGNYCDKTIPLANLSRTVDSNLVDSLMPFQREGVNFGISRNGRLLLADDMGLGKSIQAISIAAYYKTDWPVLIVCPSSLRFTWKEQFHRWLPAIREDEITVCVTGRDQCDRLINIISYDLLTKQAKQLLALHFRVVIVDESHLLKSIKTARTKAALPILKQARRVILLSGTPVLSRPNELYTQIQAVDATLFTNFQDFGVRYCSGKKMPWGWDFTGASNLPELQILLEESIMIRRLKCDVIKQLPSKIREMVVLDPEAIAKKDGEFKRSEKTLGGRLKGAERHGALLAYFQQTSKVKVNAVKNYVLDLLEAGKKFLVFVHHAVMLEALQSAVENKYEYIRIDGSVQAENRKLMCDRFQTRDEVRVALLSITAANTGLTLTAASLVVFGELFWNPGVLTQAEDRVHRIGQEDSVLIQYLVATNTADDYIWPLIQSKLAVLGKAGLSKDNFAEANTIVAPTSSKPKLQTDIMDYFKQHSDDDLTENGVIAKEARRPEEGNDIDWGDDDDDSMLEAIEAVEMTSEESQSSSCTSVEHSSKKNTPEQKAGPRKCNFRRTPPALWKMADQTTEITKPRSSVTKFQESNPAKGSDSSFDWLDSIDDEISDVMLSGGPEFKRRKLDDS